MSYSDLLLDPQWQQKRLRVMERAKWTCEECHEHGKTLHVHHTHYAKGRKPWEYADDDLRCLCVDCHNRVSRLLAELQPIIGAMGPDALEQIIGYASALAAEYAADQNDEAPVVQLGESFHHARLVGIQDLCKAPAAGMISDGGTIDLSALRASGVQGRNEVTRRLLAWQRELASTAEAH